MQADARDAILKRRVARVIRDPDRLEGIIIEREVSKAVHPARVVVLALAAFERADRRRLDAGRGDRPPIRQILRVSRHDAAGSRQVPRRIARGDRLTGGVCRIVVVLVLRVIIDLAGQIETPPCLSPEGGQTSTPPCDAAPGDMETPTVASTATGDMATTTVANSDTSFTEIAANVLLNFLPLF